MDENKRKKLVEIGYKLHECCGLCKYLKLSSPGNAFGDCMRNYYDHLKHTATAKSLSVNVFGGCKDWELAEARKNNLHAFMAFHNKKED